MIPLYEEHRAYAELARKYAEHQRRHRAEILHYRRALNLAASETTSPLHPAQYLEWTKEDGDHVETLRAPVAATLRQLVDVPTLAGADPDDAVPVWLTEANRLDLVELIAVLDEAGLMPPAPDRPARARQLPIEPKAGRP